MLASPSAAALSKRSSRHDSTTGIGGATVRASDAALLLPPTSSRPLAPPLTIASLGSTSSSSRSSWRPSDRPRSEPCGPGLPMQLVDPARLRAGPAIGERRVPTGDQRPPRSRGSTSECRDPAGSKAEVSRARRVLRRRGPCRRRPHACIWAIAQVRQGPRRAATGYCFQRGCLQPDKVSVTDLAVPAVRAMHSRAKPRSTVPPVRPKPGLAPRRPESWRCGGMSLHELLPGGRS